MSFNLPGTTVNYPESDGKPMGETDLHIEETIRLREMLKRYVASQNIYVSGNLLLFYEQGDPKKFVVPDVFVVKGIRPGRRRSYKLWVEQRAPDLIIEATSRKTKKTDTVKKPQLYRRLRVSEYFLFDPTRDYLESPLQGYRRTRRDYRPIAADAQGALVSESMGLRLQVEEEHLRLFRLDTGEPLLTDDEAREAEAKAQRVAEAEVARLRKELRRRGAS